MKLKKLVSGFAVLAMATLLLAACGGKDDKDTASSSSKEVETSQSSTKEASSSSDEVSDAPLKDGTYKLVEKNFDENGWKVDFSIEVKDGKITESNYDYVNDKGDKKSADEAYQKMMKEKAGVGPADFIPELNKELVEKQSADIDTVTGATHSSEAFIGYAKKLIKAAQEGDTATIEVDNKI